jgi:hypothetical protein
MILIGVALISFIWGGISYTREKEVLDIGPFEASAETRETIPLPPIIGGVSLVAGIVLLLAGRRQPS